MNQLLPIILKISYSYNIRKRNRIFRYSMYRLFFFSFHSFIQIFLYCICIRTEHREIYEDFIFNINYLQHTKNQRNRHCCGFNSKEKEKE